MTLGIGRRLGRLQVEAQVGEGGAACVYRVRDVESGDASALKVLTVSSPAMRRRLHQEGRMQAGLRHPNVVAVYEVLAVDGGLALRMELVEGPSLESLLRAHRPSLEDALALFEGLLCGVEAAHRAGLVHRDLKPANVLLAPSPAGLRCKVADFGIAKALGAMTCTRSGTTMGTPAYMAPEQIRDAAHVDTRADIFALGAILFELTTGDRAFPGSDPLEVMNAAAEGRHASMPPDLPQPIARVIGACLQVDPDLRPASCAELRAALYDGEPLPYRVRVRSASWAVARTLVPCDVLPAPLPVRPRRWPWLALAPLALLAASVPVALTASTALPWTMGQVATAAVRLPQLPGERAPNEADDRPAFSLAEPTASAPSPPDAPLRPNVRIEGDALRVRLAGSQGLFGEDAPIPPGTYEIRAWFPDRGPVRAGVVRIEREELVRIRCSSAWYSCSPQ